MNHARVAWDRAYLNGEAPWDLGEPDAHIVEMVRSRRLQPGRALDIGCGSGNEVIFLARNGFTAFGIDISFVALHLAQQRAQLLNVKASFVLGTADALPFCPNMATLVLDRGCFHFLSANNRARYINEVNRVLHPGGTFLLFAASNDDHDTSGPCKFAASELVALLASTFNIRLIENTRLVPHRFLPVVNFCICESKKVDD